MVQQQGTGVEELHACLLRETGYAYNKVYYNAFYILKLLIKGNILHFNFLDDILSMETGMRIIDASSDKEVLREMGERLKRLRIASLKTQAELATATGVALRTIKNLESGKDVAFSTLVKVMRALQVLQNLDDAIPPQEISPNEIMQMGKQRERVRRGGGRTTAWKWGDEG